MFGELIHNKIAEIYELFFDKDVEGLFIQFSERYAHQKNLHNFKLTKEDLWDFFTVIVISSYNFTHNFTFNGPTKKIQAVLLSKD